ncbi:MAG TPA: hypothetical protein VKT77_19710 [Chthonomonadaceae bacterium]|nr:hypothetical protein [Chthonomonadaceae bacterium]
MIRERLKFYAAMFVVAGWAVFILRPVFTHARTSGGGSRNTGQRVARKRLESLVVETVRKGHDAVELGDLTTGHALFLKALSLNGSDTLPLLYIADVSERQGNWAAALNAWDQLLDEYSGSSDAVDPVTHLHRALALSKCDREQAADAEYLKAMTSLLPNQLQELPPREFDPRKMNDRRRDAAIHLALSLLRPTDGPLYPRFEATDHRRHLEEAVRLAPTWAFARRSYARELVREHDITKALTMYADAARLSGADQRPDVLRERQLYSTPAAPSAGTRAQWRP